MLDIAIIGFADVPMGQSEIAMAFSTLHLVECMKFVVSCCRLTASPQMTLRVLCALCYTVFCIVSYGRS